MAGMRYADLEDSLRRHVHELAEGIGERNVGTPPALSAAEQYIRNTLEGIGYEVVAYPVSGHGFTSSNLEATLPGTRRPDEIVLVGAHYDTVPGSPGADDNASGVAALLEIARLCRGQSGERSLRFVAFTNEEPPFFNTDTQGSRVYARAARQRADDIRVMLSLEMLGYFRDEPGSQRYPPLFRWFYPDRGNFIALVSNFRSRRVMRRFAHEFRGASDFPLETAATFAFVPGAAWSDHLSFWRAGWRAFMVTDTAFFRNPHYHTPRDRSGTLDYARLAEVTHGLAGAVRALAGVADL